MKARDWLAAALFALATVAAVGAAVVVMAHARNHRPATPTPAQRQSLTSCYQNTGNGGC
jgi:hypothetical protein